MDKSFLNYTKGKKFLALFSAITLVSSLSFSFLTVSTASSAKPEQNASIDLDQCGNGGVGDPVIQCKNSAWQNGNLNEQQAHYVEGEFVPYRAVVDGLANGNHELTIEYDVVHSDKHAIDYLGDFNFTETNADPCSDVFAGCNPDSPTDTEIFPAATFAFTGAVGTFTGTQTPGSLSIWGGSINSVVYAAQNVNGGGKISTSVTISFSTNQPKVVLAWGGHIASRIDWGFDAGTPPKPNSAGGINGSPYHMRIVDLDGSGGNQDRSLNAGAVAAPGNLTVIKQVINDNGGTKTSNNFTINVSGGNPSPTSFPGSSTGTAVTVTANTAYSVTEITDPGYSVSYSAGCNSTGIASGSTATCTITNNDIAPTLKLVKSVQNNFGGTKAPADFTLKAEGDGGFSDNGASTTFHQVKANTTYTLTEDEIFGYQSAGWQCDGGSLNGNQLTLSLSQNVTCTLTNNDKPAKFTIIKVVENGDNETPLTVQDFSDYYFDGEVVVLSNPEGTQGQVVLTNLSAGTYSFTETQQANYTAEFTGDCSLQGVDIGGVTLNIGEEKSCTITNTYQRPLPETGTIRIIKNVVNDNGGSKTPQDFTFNVEATNSSDDVVTGDELVGDSEKGEAVITAEVGSFTITEQETPGYNADELTCGGEVVAGEEVVCEFTNNDIPGTIIVEKTVINDSRTGESLADDFSAILTGDNEYDESQSFISNEDELVGSTTFEGLVAGDYNVSESGPGGYSPSYGGDCDSEGNVTVGIGETKTCTILNNDNPPTNFDVSVSKVADDTTPDAGQTLVYTIEVSNSGPATATNVELTDVIPAGLSYVEDDGGDATSFSGDTLTWQIGNLTSGQTATLKITVTVDEDSIGQSIDNTASVPVDENDTNSENNESTETVTVTRYFSLSGYVYRDDSPKNGEFDKEEENGLSGWTVYLDEDESDSLNGEELSTESSEGGYYEFTGLSAGCYTVREVLKANWEQTEPTAELDREYLVSLGGADCGFSQQQEEQTLSFFSNLFAWFSPKTAEAAEETFRTTDLNFGNFEIPPSGGGGGGGGGSSVPTPVPTPVPQVLGDTTTTPEPSLPAPQVLPETTELPRTGAGSLALLLPGILAAAAFWKKRV